MPDNIEAVVRGEGIVKTFKDFWGRDKVKALRGVDIVIPKGSVFGLLGPNGAGKSTLIKLILGHLYPTSGRLSVLGKDPRDVEIKFKIGYLPERSYLYKNLTAEETLYYFGEILNLSKEQIKSRSDQLLEMVGLQNAKKRYVGEFSHGMTRRMGMAQALLNDPDFIILDEPTAGLDPVGCREVKDLIITLGKRGKTVLLTSHLLADVEDTCDELLMMYGGTVQSKGKVDELLADTNRVKVEFPSDCGVNLRNIHTELQSKAEGQFSISSPKQSLEQYFLNIVNKGNKTQETAGAQQGAGVAAYLRAGLESADEGKEQTIVDESLLAKQPVQEPSRPDPVEEKRETPVKQSVQDVVKTEPVKAVKAPEPKVEENVPEVQVEAPDVESVKLAELSLEQEPEEPKEEMVSPVSEGTVQPEESEVVPHLETQFDELRVKSEPVKEVVFVDDEEDEDLDEQLLDDLTI